MRRRRLSADEKSRIKNLIRQYIIAEGLTNEETAIRLNKKYPQVSSNGINLTQKINNATIKVIEFIELLDVLGYDLKIEKRK